MAAPLFTSRMVAVNPDRTWSFESLKLLQSLVALVGGDTETISASRITVSPTGGLSSTDAQSALAELDAEKATTASLTAHITDTTDAHAASAITNTPAGNIAATTVQAAINELDTEKLAASAVGTMAAQNANAVAITGGTIGLASGTLGYATGNGGTVVQATSKSTTVSLNKITGEITMDAAALAAGAEVQFTMDNTTIVATDRIAVNHVSGGTYGAYSIQARALAGGAQISVRNVTAGSLSEAVVIGFTVIKGATS